MKNFNKIIYIIIIVMFAHTHTASAAMRATFPDSKSLQPLPPDTYPNISGNMNSTVQSPPVSETDENMDENNYVPPTEEIVTTDAQKKSPNYVLWSIIALIIICSGFVFYFKKRRI